MEVSARKFIGLVESKANEKGVRPFSICGVSKATFHRWKNGTTAIPMEKAVRISMLHSIDDSSFLSKKSLTEAFLADRKEEVARLRALHTHYSQCNDQQGAAYCLSVMAILIVSKFTAAGHEAEINSSYKPQSSPTVRVILKPRMTRTVFGLVIFGENGDMYMVLEDDKASPILGMNVSPKNISKLLKNVLEFSRPEKKNPTLEDMAIQLIYGDSTTKTRSV